ncbi:MAG TPA: hypothetical protein DCS93_42785 [Microscillaceae bacterium]|nr:hypothetical protein [Microscillaceae bacterium]
MEILIDNKYNQIYIDQDTGIHYHITKKDTMYMSEEEFKDMLLKWKQSILTIRPKYSIVDNRDFNFFIAPEMQLWTVENIANEVYKVLEKSCFVMPEEFIANLSVAQLTDEVNQKEEEQRMHYFSTMEKAKSWILSE